MNEYLKILGSVSPYPTRKNGCPGYLVYINNNKILFDCGPGVCSKLNFPEDLSSLSIFISHYHKDHYSDLFSIGYASYVYSKLGILKQKINLYIPKPSHNGCDLHDYYIINKFNEHYFNIIEYDEYDKFEFSNINISFMKNYHSIDSYSTKINYNGKVFIYTSDLGYSSKDSLVSFAKNADFLLIESSFLISDNQKSDYHLCAHESAIIAKEANVKVLILTHFWPKHSSKKYLKEAKKVFKNTKVVSENKIMYI